MSRPITWRLAVRFPLSLLKKIGELTAGGVAVHLLATAGVPLIKTPYTHPHPPTSAAHCSIEYGICLYECVTLCVCVCQQVPTWMG